MCIVPDPAKCVAVREGDTVYMSMSIDEASAIRTLVGKVSLATNEHTSDLYSVLCDVGTTRYVIKNDVPTIQLEYIPYIPP